MEIHRACYVMYTSGSTGRPKGVACTHTGLTNHSCFIGTLLNLSPLDRVLQFSNYAFDQSVEEIFPALMNGAGIVITDKPGGQISPWELAELVHTEGVTILDLPTAYWHACLSEWVNEGARACVLLATVRSVVIGGERLTNDCVAKFRLLNLNCQWFNTYGPTEATVICTSFQIIPGDDRALIGRPISNLAVYVLGSDLQPQPLGVPGEIYVGGHGVALGYINDHEQTSCRFIDAPGNFGQKRLYRTGDLGRYLADGNIEYLGRVDSQVKLRGYRIEPFEIERAFLEDWRVRQATVVLQEGEGEEKRLVAYIVPSEEWEAQEAQQERVDDWRTVYDTLYADSEDDSELDFTGWVSSYTGYPIPLKEMLEWHASTINTLKELKPSQVLEIGCGTGLIALPLARRVGAYVGTDISEKALASLQARLLRNFVDNAALFCREAACFEDLPPNQYDLVVINSVVQYFPNATYLADVLVKSLELVKPQGGKVFIGDVRDLRLAKHFALTLAGGNPDGGHAPDLLRGDLENAISNEEELLLTPKFFKDFQRLNAVVDHVDILLKRGRTHNELSKFRFDVVLHTQQQDQDVAPPKVRWTDWADAEKVLAARPPALLFSNIPNARIARECAALWEKHSYDDTGSSAGETVDPEELAIRIEQLGYKVRLYVSSTIEEFEVLLYDGHGAPPVHQVDFESDHDSEATNNRPLLRSRKAAFEESLKHGLSQTLPEYMVPKTLVFLDRMPLTANGKIDRNSLPVPGVRRLMSPNFSPPRNELEIGLAQLWSELLKVEAIGIHDNFFELGGHSILAIRLVASISRQLGVDVAVGTLFTCPTIHLLCAHLTAHQLPHGSDGLAPPKWASLKLGAARRFPASLGQELNYWTGNRGNPSEQRYTMPFAIPLEGRLSLEHLELAINNVIFRHDALRSNIRDCSRRKQPFQQVRPFRWLKLKVVDFSKDVEPRRTYATHRESFYGERFYLSTSRPLRLCLCRFSPTYHVLLIAIHHAFFDGWSSALLADELTASYRDAIAGVRLFSQDGPMPVQYGEYAQFQRRYVEDMLRDPTPRLRKWCSHLAGPWPELQYSGLTDVATPQRFEGAVHHLLIDAENAEKIQAYCRSKGLTLFVVLLSAFRTVVSYFSHENDITIECAYAGRPTEQLLAAIGKFADTQLIRTRNSLSSSFSEICDEVKRQASEATFFEWIPYWSLRDLLVPPEFPSSKRFTQLRFVLNNYYGSLETKSGSRPTDLATFRGTAISTQTGSSTRDITLYVTKTATGIYVKIEHNSRLFSEQQIGAFSRTYSRFLISSVAADATPVMQHISAAPPPLGNTYGTE